MSLPPKLVSVVCLVQCFLIGMGFLFTRAFIHLFKTVTELGDRFIPALPLFIGHYGLWFLLLPIVWTVAAASLGEVDYGVVSIKLGHFIAGIVLTVGLGILFGFSTFVAFASCIQTP
jgi:hypothetical protein